MGTDQSMGSLVANIASGFCDLARTNGDVDRASIRDTLLSSGAWPRSLPNLCTDPVRNDVCCLAWILSELEHGLVDEARLTSFLTEVETRASKLNAVVAVEEATSGLIESRGMPHLGKSPEDAAVQLGQLICQWALSQEPPFGVRVGVHTGRLKHFKLPNSKDESSFYGDAYSRSLELALESQHQTQVHISSISKLKLQAYMSVPVVISGSFESYYVDPFAEAAEARREHVSVDGHEPAGAQLQLTFMTRQDTTDIAGKMSLDEFKDLLITKNIDTASFGCNGAKTLLEFYQDVVISGKAHLVEVDDTLERIVPLLRISLQAMEGDRTRELRVSSTRDVDGRERLRHQPLALVLTLEETLNWALAVQTCLRMKLDLSSETQAECLEIDESSYVVSEDRVFSPSVPGIFSTYKSQNVTVRVKDQTHPRMKSIGLPEYGNFSTTKGGVDYDWTWTVVGSTVEEDKLLRILHDGGVDMKDWTEEMFSRLHREIQTTKTATIEKRGVELTRTLRIIRVWVRATIHAMEQVLVIRRKIQGGKTDERDKNRPISMQMSGQDWSQAVTDALLTRLGMSEELQDQLLTVDEASHQFSEEVANSRSFPGLKTAYLVNEVTVYLTNTRSSDLHFLGLPDGSDFVISRAEGAVTKETSIRSKPTTSNGHILVVFGWNPVETAVSKSQSLRNRKTTFSDTSGTVAEALAKRQVPAPVPLPPAKMNGPLLKRLLKNARTDWTRARRAAARICDATYTCQDFHNDITASFPELRLYVAGTSSADEYQRTIGAMYVIFWLMRMHLDGKDCFCFGLKADMVTPRKKFADCSEDAETFERRQFFREHNDWKKLEGLFLDAGLLTAPGQHDPEQTLAMLVLMAIHDIMKSTVLLPRVEREFGDFAGYAVGEVISDHDLALSYILQNHPTLLPSFSGLSRQQQESVKFTHGKLDYNLGGLVLAEAPPGALFSALRSAVIARNATKRDIAFYFVHWFADLAGSEPYPAEGSERFVLRFPMRGFQHFVDSFSIVGTLSESVTETQVYESYLVWRWAGEQGLGPVPRNIGSIAKMRLVIMAQGYGRDVLRTFEELSDEDREVLCKEMAVTGCEGQYGREPQNPGGPAIQVHHGPFLVHRVGRHNPRVALRVLAELLRKARLLWPFNAKDAKTLVTIRCHSLGGDANSIEQPGHDHVWLLSRTNDAEGSVKKMPVASLGTVVWSTHEPLTFAEKR